MNVLKSGCNSYMSTIKEAGKGLRKELRNSLLLYSLLCEPMPINNEKIITFVDEHLKLAPRGDSLYSNEVRSPAEQ